MIEERSSWLDCLNWTAILELRCAGRIRTHRIGIARLAKTSRSPWISRQPVVVRIEMNATGRTGLLA